jgi:hypothetical protein
MPPAAATSASCNRDSPASVQPLAKQIAPPAPSAASSRTTDTVAWRFTPMKVASGASGKAASAA